MPRPTLAELPQVDQQSLAAPSLRPVYFSPREGWHQTRVYQRSTLCWGSVIEGPALIEEYASTTVIFPGDHLKVDRFGNLIIEVNNEGN
jgi:N-methylhydantoinase A